jgi:hypothetical protein
MCDSVLIGSWFFFPHFTSLVLLVLYSSFHFVGRVRFPVIIEIITSLLCIGFFFTCGVGCWMSFLYLQFFSSVSVLFYVVFSISTVVASVFELSFRCCSGGWFLPTGSVLVLFIGVG